jgi:hypothetical protein
MKNIPYILILTMWICVQGYSQTQVHPPEGKISFTTKKSIYVRFESTEGIQVGDTLSVLVANEWRNILLVRQKSSTSCVTDNLDIAVVLTTGLNVRFNKKPTVVPAQEEPTPDVIKPAVTLDEPSVNSSDTITSDTSVLRAVKERKPLLSGRFTLTTNGMLNPDETSNFQRVRAAFSMQLQNINKSPVSVQTYLTYRYRFGIDQVNSDFFNDFKVFSLALEYAPDKPYKIWAGRRINSYIANLGTIDGVQAEFTRGKYIFGTFAGTRPDFQNFSFNINLPQFGVYAVRNDQIDNGGNAQTTLALSEQQNTFRTDRRFVYFQHSNSLVKRLNFFFSSELDIFKKELGVSSNTLRLTSLYASLRYRIRSNLSITGSYDNRRNVIFYESYQTFIDQLLAEETRQGLRMQINYAPFRFMSINTSAFWRYQGDNPQPTTNYVGNLNFTGLPGLFKTLNVSVNLLESYYFKGRILGARLNGQALKGRLGMEVQYRNVNYNFFSSESALLQHIGGISLSIPLLKKTILMVNYEGTFEPSKDYHRYFITFVQRFK